MKPHEKKIGIKQEWKRRGKIKGDKKPNKKRRKDNKTLSQKSEKGSGKNLTKGNKRKELKIKVLTHELLDSTFSYLMLAPWWYTNPSNLSSRTPPISSLVVLWLSSYYRFVLLPHYELVPPRASVAYAQTISSDVARASTQLVSPSVSHVCHHFGPDLFLCGHKSIVACASQLRLVVRYVTS
jgi:hypothetical protein